MRRLKAKFTSSFVALLGSGEAASAALEAHTEVIRQLILDELGESGEKAYPQIIRGVRYAKDIQGLWYTRCSVMTALAAMHGETIAREKMVFISEKFQGLLPRSLSSRPSPLSS